MLCCFSSGNFPNQCKKGVKCIKSRIVIIRRKKQAMLRCLRKDVADLLANGHDTKAFGRIQELIVEMNLASCYDMIEQYCECILQQLPSLQKKRECSENAMEAMSTLIFAAARFADLPELCDLRHVFTERYGSQMKSSINGEFVNKVQKKSFSMDKKLQVMQGIAEEFSVSWNSKAFQQTNSSRPVAPSSDQPKTQQFENNDHLSPAENNWRNAAVKGKKEAVTNADGDLQVLSKERWKPVQKEQVQPDGKNRKKVHHAAEVPENVKPYFSDSKVLQSIGSHKGTHKDDRFSEGTVGNRSQMTKEPDHIGLEKQSVGSVVSRDVKTVSLIPLYTKSKGGRNETDIKVCLPSHDELPKTENWLDPIAQERLHPKIPNSNNASLLNAASTASDDSDQRPKPFSVRTKHTKLPLVENKNVVVDAKPTIQTSSSRRKGHRRIASLPSEPTNPIPEVMSLQSAMVSPNGRLVHPNLPDYDELAARINALMKT